jgi:Icc-related predicted phosphoesterase
MTKLTVLHLSDTHGFHEGKCERAVLEMIEKFNVDVVVHSGDFMRHSMKFQELVDIFDFLKSLPVEHKILVPGNHDVWCEQLEQNEYLRHATVPDDIHLLINEEVVIDGIKFWGSPYTPWYYDWAFQLHEHEAEALWPTIPDDTDVLITHGPAKFILDDMFADNELKRQRIQERSKKPYLSALGCKYLAKRVKELEHLRAHLFGHIHGGYGRDESHGYVALNSSIMNEQYAVVNKPQVVVIKK